ncbi:MAG: hypothetical protein HN353_14165 [Bdellovibrionales bacterium]|jgi:hypothetical protein|nr:hypothetical protein [Bdellovibrionales bacterium]MBT3527014.1 hypothetical protein [Bdellovibrionales bacterium]MBT7669519.1 hypothetical protein [Bdellovibrionales bacterium]MBT7765781.1 hypothetical protein [Bdellovibrionales bacterium]
MPYNTHITQKILILITLCSFTWLNAAPPSTNPAPPGDASVITRFDWQAEWGTIHMNTFTDGLQDSLSSTTESGLVPCYSDDAATNLEGVDLTESTEETRKLAEELTAKNSLCALMKKDKAGKNISQYSGGFHHGAGYPLDGDQKLKLRSSVEEGISIDHGIKFDIKNSVLNCMSRITPNYPLLNGGWGYQFSNNVCDSVSLPFYYNDTENRTHSFDEAEYSAFYADSKSALEKNDRTMLYSPLWDVRGNDLRTQGAGGIAGCMQQLSNSCFNTTNKEFVKDIHNCKYTGHDSDPAGTTSDENGKGYQHPISHVFSHQEIADLDLPNAHLPASYNAYLKAETTTHHVNQASIPNGKKYINMTTTNSGTTLYTYDEVNTHRRALYYKKDDSMSDHPSDCVKEWPEESKCLDWEVVNNYSQTFYDRIPSYKVDLSDSKLDINQLVIVDPAPFFDLNLYTKGHLHSKGVAGGGYPEIGYSAFTADDLVVTPNSCPIVGLEGYGGICDPEDKAGCNLPVYGASAPTILTSENGSTYNYKPYPIKWSGYVKKWAMVTSGQYLGNVEGRIGVNGGELYADAAGISDDPVLMITRSVNHCDRRELFSGQVTTDDAQGAPDLECIQYLQYQYIDWEVCEDDSDPTTCTTYDDILFVDLFQPQEVVDPGMQHMISLLHVYNVGEDELPMMNNPVSGTGTDQYLDPQFTLTEPLDGYLSFLEPSINTINYYRMERNEDGELVPVPYLALTRTSYIGDSEIFGTTGDKTVGMYLGRRGRGERTDITEEVVKEDIVTTSGTGLQFSPTVVHSIRYPQPDSSQTECYIVTGFDVNLKMFLPTNIYSEFKQFIDSASSNSIPNVYARKCNGEFMTHDQIANTGTRNNLDEVGSMNNGTSTWAGTLSCDALTEKPLCNHSELITAERFCMLEDGQRGDCSYCKDANDPDGDLFASTPITTGKDSANREALRQSIRKTMVKYEGRRSSCYFSAVCTNVNAEGCPAANTSGGHVFCLSPETKITMANGKSKAIINIKAGESVLAFDAKEARTGKLRPARVKATAITDNQKVITITVIDNSKRGARRNKAMRRVGAKGKESVLKITPLHRVLLDSGRGVMAEDIAVGDRILKSDGSYVTVVDVDNNSDRMTVYNLVLEDGFDGYIANGLRVLSYPITDGMKVMQ